MSEKGEEDLGQVLARLDKDPQAYAEACQGAAEEMQRRYIWDALMEKWKGSWDTENG